MIGVLVSAIRHLAGEIVVEQQNASRVLWEGIRVYSGLLFVQRALLGDGLGVGQNQQAADDDSRDDVGHSGKRACAKTLLAGSA